MKLLALAWATALSLAATSPNSAPNEANLRAADAEQMRIIVEGDAKAQQEFMHPNYIINAPANVVRRKPELVADLARGAMGSESFQRVIEGTAITGNVGIVMGREVVRPTATSNLGKLHPGQTLHRRFTNVFIWEGGKWRFLARQASIIAPTVAH
jgi:hypothetical protein